MPANLTFWSRATVAMIFGHPPLTVGKTGRQREWEHGEETECRILDIGGGGEAGAVTFLAVFDWRGTDSKGERRKEK